LSRRVHFSLDLASIIFYCGVIFFLSSIPRPVPPVYPFPGFDKVAHVVLYGGLGILVCRFLANDLRRAAPASMIVAAAFTTLYGLSDEIHQAFVPGRIAAASDFAANTAGAVLAVLAWYYILRPKGRPALFLMAQEPEGGGEDDLPV
jgi:VanZ family protein